MAQQPDPNRPDPSLDNSSAAPSMGPTSADPPSPDPSATEPVADPTEASGPAEPDAKRPIFFKRKRWWRLVASGAFFVAVVVIVWIMFPNPQSKDTATAYLREQPAAVADQIASTLLPGDPRALAMAREIAEAIALQKTPYNCFQAAKQRDKTRVVQVFCTIDAAVNSPIPASMQLDVIIEIDTNSASFTPKHEVVTAEIDLVTLTVNGVKYSDDPFMLAPPIDDLPPTPPADDGSNRPDPQPGSGAEPGPGAEPGEPQHPPGDSDAGDPPAPADPTNTNDTNPPR